MRKISDPTRVVLQDRCTLYQQKGTLKWYCRIKLEDGTWYRLATNEISIDKARDKAIDLFYEAKLKAKNKLPSNTRTFASVAKSIVEKLESLKDTREWKETYKSYISAINKYQIPYFGHTKLDNIRAKYEGYIKHVSDQLDRMPTQSTIANHHAALKLVLSEAVTRGWATNDTLPVLKNVGKQSIRRPTFDIGEYRSLIQKLKHWSQKKSHRHKDTEIREMLYDYALILANSGIRHGREALELKWSNISFEKSKKGNDVVTIVATKKKGRKATEERRTVVVRHNDFSDFKKILERIKDRNPQLQAMTLEQIIKKRMDELLFCLSDGTQPARIDGTFKKFLTDADLGVGAEGIQRTLYSFRHFYATQELLREPPITIHLLAKQMGTSVKMIEKHYGHTEPFQKADRLSGWNDIE